MQPLGCRLISGVLLAAGIHRASAAREAPLGRLVRLGRARSAPCQIPAGRRRGSTAHAGGPHAGAPAGHGPQCTLYSEECLISHGSPCAGSASQHGAGSSQAGADAGQCLRCAPGCDSCLSSLGRPCAGAVSQHGVRSSLGGWTLAQKLHRLSGHEAGPARQAGSPADSASALELACSNGPLARPASQGRLLPPPVWDSFSETWETQWGRSPPRVHRPLHGRGDRM